MTHKERKFLTVFLWGTGMYAFQDFVSNPNTRIQIIATLVISYLIYTANQFFMKDNYYSDKYLRHAVPILIMNAVLIPLNVAYGIINHYKFSQVNILGYIIFNILVFIIYFLQHSYYKKRINRQLKAKISNID